MKHFLLFLLIWPSASLAAQPVAADEKALFESGVKAYRTGTFKESRRLFEEILGRFPEGRLHTSTLLMLSKTYGKLQYPKKSVHYADRLINAFPGSAYAGDALMTKAAALYQLNDYAGAIAALSKFKQLSNDKKTSRRADSLVTAIARTNLSSDEMAGLSLVEPDPAIRQVLETCYIDNAMAHGRYNQTRAYVGSLLKKESSTARQNFLRNLLRQLDDKEEGPVRIGLIVSLTGTNSEIGKAIKAGVEVAVEQHNSMHQPRIELAVYDDQSDIIQAIFAARELTSDESISAIIGPIESSAMAAAAVIADQRHVPIVSPTATRSGLTQIGEWVYQANVNIEARSEALARYAVIELGLKKFAILAPSDNYGDIASTAFAKTVEKLGGKMIVIEKFYDNTSDFKGQLVHLRKMGFIERALPQSSYRSLSRLTSLQIDSMYAQYYPIDSASTENEFNVPMDFIDALFLPVYTEDIKYIAPQLAFYNIKTQLLGGDNWYDLTELKLHQNYINGVCFVSESYMDLTHRETRTFSDALKKTGTAVLLRDAAYGYDLMNLIASVIQEGYFTGEEIHGELRKGISWTGLHNKIIFTKDSRVNSSVHILQFNNGQIKKLSD